MLQLGNKHSLETEGISLKTEGVSDQPEGVEVVHSHAATYSHGPWRHM